MPTKESGGGKKNKGKKKAKCSNWVPRKLDVHLE
jgi:hypothetical protein